MGDLISVIVPIYNVEPYLPKCIDSILAQTYRNLEIILVDDGSPDNCGKICDDYAKKDSRIHVIHKPNGGVSDARNAGLDAAHGEYIAFVDPDDWIDADMYEYLFRGLASYNADISVCEYHLEYPDKSVARHRDADRYYEGKAAVEAVLHLDIANYSCNKLFRRHLFDEIRYPVGQIYEDVRITYRLFEKCSSAVSLREPKYHYLQNPAGIVANPSIAYRISAVESRMSRYRVVNDQYPELRPFLLKEVYRYLIRLRDSICAAGSREFASQTAELKLVTQFLRDFKDDLLRHADPGRLGRMELWLMCRGRRMAWLAAKGVDKLREWKKSVTGCDLYKKTAALRKRLRGSAPLYRYYYKCLKLPLDENLALLECRGGEAFAGNLYYIAGELKNRGLRVVLSVRKKEAKKIRQQLRAGQIQNVEIVYKKSKEYYKAFATAKYLFNDAVYENAILKRRGQIWTNVWCGTPFILSKSSTARERFKSSGEARELLKTDYIAAPSKFMADAVVESARVSNLLTCTKALYSGSPRNQVFFDTARREELRFGMGIADKEVFIYMPVRRKAPANHVQAGEGFSVDSILDFFEQALSDHQIMYVQFHDVDNAPVDCTKYSRIRPFPAGREQYDFLNAADCLITDYANVFFDFANTGRKILLFPYDRDEYLLTHSLSVSLEQLPFPKAYTFKEMQEQLNIRKEYDDSAFRAQYCSFDCADSAKKLVNHVLGSAACEVEKITGNGKRNCLYYDARFSYRPFQPENAVRAIQSFDDLNCNYYYAYTQRSIKRWPQYLLSLPACFGPYVFAQSPAYTPWSVLLMDVFHLPTRQLIQNELNREMYGLPFDEIHIMDNNKFDEHAVILSAYLKREKRFHG